MNDGGGVAGSTVGKQRMLSDIRQKDKEADKSTYVRQRGCTRYIPPQQYEYSAVYVM